MLIQGIHPVLEHMDMEESQNIFPKVTAGGGFGNHTALVNMQRSLHMVISLLHSKAKKPGLRSR
jgi:hypothetical protein